MTTPEEVKQFEDEVNAVVTRSGEIKEILTHERLSAVDRLAQRLAGDEQPIHPSLSSATTLKIAREEQEKGVTYKGDELEEKFEKYFADYLEPFLKWRVLDELHDDSSRASRSVRGR